MEAHPTAPELQLCDVEWRLPLHPRTVGRFRRLLREQADAWGLPDDTTEAAVLLLSELATNACRHARVPRGREVAARFLLCEDGTLRVEVSDANNTQLPTQPIPAGLDDESGRGLFLVAALSDKWGTQPRAYGIGKTVWFELGCQSPLD